MNTPRRFHTLLKPVRIVRSHVRLFAAAIAGFIVALMLPGDWHFWKRFLVGSDVTAALYLAQAFVIMSRFDLKRLKRHAALADEGAVVVLLLSVIAVAVSLAAIVIELGSAQKLEGSAKALSLTLATTTILLSWLFIQTIFALHYAHAFYGEGERGGGLQFPNDDEPDYWDFIYFSLVIGMTFQVSDVQVTSKRLRPFVALHGLVSFFFNVAILALMINIAGTLLGT